MGLLDEAIREHLELKRRRGADPSAVAREEREALAPVFPDESVADGDESADDAPEPVEIAPAAVPADGRPHDDERLADLSAVGQETAELDMQAVMEEDPDAADGGSPVGPIVDGPAPAYAGEPAAEDSLDWGFPGDRERGSVPEDIPGQERLSFE
ncbi:MAG: hypothetical protein ACLPUT_05880 [Solirubrobacteraceae bacterium]